MIFESKFSRKVREVENAWIPMRDGKQLAARIWLPEDAEEHSVPAILELIPYRKRDGTSLKDEIMHPYFAGHGYAAIRVDLRGAGDSEGVLEDEYCPKEQEDGLTIIEWIAQQSWCNGRVGMIGLSWGGFNSLQIAACRPAALKAIITVGSSDDRYADDVHYMGGCLLTAKFTWGQQFFSDLNRPPDPVIVGERWKEMWLERLNSGTLFLDKWLRPQLRNNYWKHGSICEDWGAIQCAVFAVGGWADSYTNSVSRLIENLRCPRLGLIGPWGHDFPHTAVPGPRIGFLDECLRWWDYWLKSIETGIMQEPIMRMWLQSSVSSHPSHKLRPGNWIQFQSWPPKQNKQYLHAGAEGLTAEKQEQTEFVHSSLQTVGSSAGEWCPYGICADQPAEQTEDDFRSLTLQTRPLREQVRVIGSPVLNLAAQIDQTEGLFCVRLDDVDPNGQSTRVSYGILNVTHRCGHSRRVPAVPNERMNLTIRLCDTAYTFQVGHKMRIAVSTAYWPTVWPSPKVVTARIFSDETYLELPDSKDFGSYASEFPVARGAMPEPRTILAEPVYRRVLHRNVISGEEILEAEIDDGIYRLDKHGLEIGRRCVEKYSILPHEPLSARCEAYWSMKLRRDDWAIRTEATSSLRCTEGEFVIEMQFEAFHGDEVIFERSYSRTVPRDGV